MNKELGNNELKNLMQLLDEEDEDVYKKISERIISFGLAAIPYLEGNSEKSTDIRVQSRVKKLIRKIRVQALYIELHNWSTMESGDLLKGYFICSKYLFPDLDEASVMAKVEALKKDVWLELNKNMSPFDELKVVSQVFFELKKFAINANPDACPDSLCLNAVLNSGKGHPIALKLLYVGIAQRLDIPVYGVDAYDSIFLAYVNKSKTQAVDLKKDVLFYLNPFAAGLCFSKQHMNTEDEKRPLQEDEKIDGASSNQFLIMEVIRNMVDVYILQDKKEKVADLITMATALVEE